MRSILRQVYNDIVEFAPVYVAISCGPADSVAVLASLGLGVELIEAQANRLGGPWPDAVASGLPVAVADVWSDPRWPQLTRKAMTGLHPTRYEAWQRIEGVAVMPAGHAEHSMVALSCALSSPADERVIAVLARYRQLIEAAIVVTRATAVEGSKQVLDMLQSRAVIEQAKGAIVGKIACSPDYAWQCLRVASQTFNVKLRDVAIALIEVLSNTPAEHPAGFPRPSAAPAAWKAAIKLWEGLI